MSWIIMTCWKQEFRFPLLTPGHFRFFTEVRKWPIRVTGQSDGRLDEGDVIQFLGKRNDGTSDTPLYRNPEHQAHQYYNLFTDESAYFF